MCKGATDNTLHEDEIIAQAREIEPDLQEAIGQPGLLLAALNVFSLHGSADETSGDAETFGHFFRVHRWIVWTDSAGFHDIETHDNERDAIAAFQKYDAEFAATFDEGEDGV